MKYRPMVNNSRAVLALVIIFSLAPVLAKPTLAADPPAAIIVTNGAYDYNPPISIPTAEADGDAFQKHLVAAGFDPTRIERYKDPTYDTFKNLIGKAQVAYKNVTAFVFYYSGHGILYGPTPRFVPRDFSFTKVVQGKILSGMRDQTIPVEDILRIAKEGGRPALFVFDACRDEGPNNLYDKLYSFEQKEALADGRQSMMNVLPPQGVFDNIQDHVVPGEFFDRYNILTLLAAVKTQWGPGLSYYLNGEALSVFTGTLLSYVDQSPGLGLAEIAARVKFDVLMKTAKLKPPQLPYYVDDITGNFRFSDFANPPPPLNIGPLLSAYADQVGTSQLQAVVANRSFIVSAPIKLEGVSIAGLSHASPPPVFTSPQAAPPASATIPPPPALQVKMTARLWSSSTDEKVYGPAGNAPAIRIPNRSTTVTRLLNGLTEYRNRIVADPGFRIMKVNAATRSIKNVDTINTVRETDIEGVTAETIVWTVSNGEAGRSPGYYTADLDVAERRPRGTMFLPLTGVFDLRQDQSVVLQLTPENIRQLDALQLIGTDGNLIAELQPGVAKIVKGLNWWLALRMLNGGLVLQTSGVSSAQ
jgi:hypothetical protein